MWLPRLLASAVTLWYVIPFLCVPWRKYNDPWHSEAIYSKGIYTSVSSATMHIDEPFRLKCLAWKANLWSASLCVEKSADTYIQFSFSFFIKHFLSLVTTIFFLVKMSFPVKKSASKQQIWNFKFWRHATKKTQRLDTLTSHYFEVQSSSNFTIAATFRWQPHGCRLSNILQTPSDSVRLRQTPPDSSRLLKRSFHTLSVS